MHEVQQGEGGWAYAFLYTEYMDGPIPCSWMKTWYHHTICPVTRLQLNKFSKCITIMLMRIKWRSRMTFALHSMKKFIWLSLMYNLYSNSADYFHSETWPIAQLPASPSILDALALGLGDNYSLKVLWYTFWNSLFILWNIYKDVLLLNEHYRKTKSVLVIALIMEYIFLFICFFYSSSDHLSTQLTSSFDNVNFQFM